MTARQCRPPAGPVSFDAVYACERSRLVRYLMAMGAGYYQADDAVQAAFTRAYDRWDTIRQPRAWLYKVALRESYRADTPRGPGRRLAARPNCRAGRQ